MIELRWVKLEGPSAEPGKVFFDAGFAKLQYRKVTNLEEISLQPPIWSDWQDVPIMVLQDL